MCSPSADVDSITDRVMARLADHTTKPWFKDFVASLSLKLCDHLSNEDIGALVEKLRSFVKYRASLSENSKAPLVPTKSPWSLAVDESVLSGNLLVPRTPPNMDLSKSKSPENFQTPVSSGSGSRTPDLFSPTPADRILTPSKSYAVDLNAIQGDSLARFESSLVLQDKHSHESESKGDDEPTTSDPKPSTLIPMQPVVIETGEKGSIHQADDDISFASPFLKTRKIAPESPSFKNVDSEGGQGGPSSTKPKNGGPSFSQEVLLASPFIAKTENCAKKPKKPLKTKQKRMDDFLQGTEGHKLEMKPPIKQKKARPKVKITANESFFDNYEKIDNGLVGQADVHAKPSKKREDRQKMHGHDCACCKDYYDGLGLSADERRARIESVSRHRAYVPPPSTPPGFWDYRFPSTPECIHRGYMKESECVKKKRQQQQNKN